MSNTAPQMRSAQSFVSACHVIAFVALQYVVLHPHCWQAIGQSSVCLAEWLSGILPDKTELGVTSACLVAFAC